MLSTSISSATFRR
jgi:cation transport ATPase